MPLSQKANFDLMALYKNQALINRHWITKKTVRIIFNILFNIKK